MLLLWYSNVSDVTAKTQNLIIHRNISNLESKIFGLNAHIALHIHHFEKDEFNEAT